MKARIIQIGNSLGVRLPKPVLASLNLDRESTVSVQTRGGSIVLRPVKNPRAPWAQAFAAGPDTVAENLWGDLPVHEGWES